MENKKIVDGAYLEVLTIKASQYDAIIEKLLEHTFNGYCDAADNWWKYHMRQHTKYVKDTKD